MVQRLTWFLLLCGLILLLCYATAPLRAQELPSHVLVPLELPTWGRSAVIVLPSWPLNEPLPKAAGITVRYLPTPVAPKPAAVPTAKNRALQAANGAKLVAWLNARMWYREASGRNDGPQVSGLIKAGGGQSGWPWCGYTQLAAHKAYRLSYPAGAAKASNWFIDPKHAYYKAGQRGSLDSILPGHAVGLSYGHGINHVTGALEAVPPLRKGRPPRGFWCGGGNEGSGTSAGIHRTFYAGPAIRAASNYNW